MFICLALIISTTISVAETIDKQYDINFYVELLLGFIISISAYSLMVLLSKFICSLF